MAASFGDSTPIARVGLVTCLASDATDLAPEGHHLRWFVPRSHGFPAAGFDLWRIEEGNWESARRALSETADLPGATRWSPALNWSGRERHYPVHRGVSIVSRADALLTPGRAGLRVAQRGSGDNLLIHFRQPVIFVRLGLQLANRSILKRPSRRFKRPRAPAPTVSVRHGAAVIQKVDLRDTVVIEHPAITDLLIPSTIAAITALEFVTELALAEHAERTTPPLAHLDLPASAESAYALAEAAHGIHNRMFSGSSIAQLRQRYRPAQVARLVSHLQSTVGDPEHRLLGRGGPDRPPAEARVLDHLLLAAVDPNVARMLACYWVDREPKAGLYMIRANYDTPDKKIGLGFAFSRDAAEAPSLPEQPRGRQLPGIEFTGRQPRGRIGLLWRTPPPTLARPATAVMVDVSRRSEGATHALTSGRPHLVTSTSEIRFTDRGVPVPDTYVYHVTPIDIFGRSGPARSTEPIRASDLRPVPPRNLVASLEQHGAPWADPAQRDPSRDLTGSVSASAEFGEAEHTLAADAAQLRWCWRSGRNEAASRDPSAWQVLGTTPIKAPDTVQVSWPGGARLTRYPLEVATTRIFDEHAAAALLERLDPITADAAPALPPPGPLLEILLNVALLEPDLFVGHRLATGRGVITVVGSTAGIAFAHDKTKDRRLTARLFVPLTKAASSIAAGDVLTLDHPLGRQWRPGLAREADGAPAPPPLLAIPLPDDAPAPNRAYGGEVAIDLRYALESSATGEQLIRPVDHDDASGHQQATIVGRVVADHRPGGARSVLIRVRPDGADRLIQIERLGSPVHVLARHYRPYVMPQAQLGLDGADGAIKLDLAPGQRFETLSISAFTVDDEGNLSERVAIPAELRVVRPPPAARAAPPFPEKGGATAQRGELSPPNVDGDSTAAVAWAAIDVEGMAPHVRYELSRALDTTIIAADRERWLRGAPLAAAEALGAVPGASVSLTAQSRPEINANGTVCLVADPPQSSAELKTLLAIARGRVRLGSGAQAQYHSLVRAVVLPGGSIELLLRPFVEATQAAFSSVRAGTHCRIEAEPDYSTVLADSDRLRQLADLPGTDGRPGDSNERAFGLVTGVPMAAQRFVDRLPGRGRSRFFYKLRAVYPGETRSAWSPCSVAFHQLDATRADPPADVAIIESDAGRLASFRLPDDPLVIGVRLSTGGADGQPAAHQDLLLTTDEPAQRLQPARLTARRGLVDLRQVVGPGALVAGGSPTILGLYPADADRSAPPTSANLLPVDGATGAPLITRSVAVPRVHDGRPLALRIADEDGARWLDAIPGRFEIELGPSGRPQALATLKYVAIGGATTPFHSAEVPLGGGARPGAGEEGDDVSG